MNKEQYYIDLFKPEYNILTKAGSSFGSLEETLDKFKLRIVSDETRINLSEAAKGRVLSEQVKAKISASRKGLKLSKQTRAKLSAAMTIIKGIAVEITNIKTGKIKEYLTH